jgi:hypothetical protein
MACKNDRWETLTKHVRFVLEYVFFRVLQSLARLAGGYGREKVVELVDVFEDGELWQFLLVFCRVAWRLVEELPF